MALLNIQEMHLEGVDIIFTAADRRGDHAVFGNKDRPILLVRNKSSDGVIVTIKGKIPDRRNKIYDMEVLVPPGEEAYYLSISGIRREQMNNGKARADFAYSSVADLQVAFAVIKELS